MNFTFSKFLEEPNDYIIFANSEFISRVNSAVSITENIVGVGTFLKEFRWSKNGNTYSDWILFTLSNLQNHIHVNIDDLVYLQIKYTLLSGGPVEVNNIIINFDLDEIHKFENFKPSRIFSPHSYGNLNNPLVFSDTTFNPYAGYEKLLHINREFSYMVNHIYGHDVKYFRALPQQRNKDLVFLEYTLYDVNLPIDFKLIVPDNTFPDNKLNYTMFGIDFEQPFEVHIDKRYFEHRFGIGVGPQTHDIIYFPITNRVYEISSSMLFREFMHQPIFWKVNLIKWEPKSNVYMPESGENEFDLTTYTQGYESLFNEINEKEQQDIVNKQQTTDTNTVSDPVRNNINSELLIREESIMFNFVTASKYYYDLNHLYLTTKSNDKAIEYKYKSEFDEKSEINFSCWFRDRIDPFIKSEVLTFTKNSADITIIMKNASYLENIEISDILKLNTQNSSHLSFPGAFGKIISKDIETSTIIIRIPSWYLTFIDNNYNNWNNYGSWFARKISYRHFIYGHDNSQKGLSVYMAENKFIIIKINENEHVFTLANALQKNKWYAISCNISSSFKQLSLFIWESPVNDSGKLVSVNKTTLLYEPVSYVSNKTFELRLSPLEITNIRVMKTTIEEEKQQKFLSQFNVKDASYSHIMDNAIPRLKLPYIGNVK